MRERVAIALGVIGCVLFTGAGAAAAAARPAAAGPGHARRAASVTSRLGLAGYYFRTTTGRVLVKAHVTVPTATCGGRTRPYQVQVGAGFSVGGQHENAVVLLLLKCRNGRERAGAAQLIAGFHAAMSATPVNAGQTVSIRVVVYGARAVASIYFPNHTSARVSAGGGRPSGVVYALTLPNASPPHYAPVKFTGAFVNRRALGRFHPSAWTSVTRYGGVDGTVSAIGSGAAFTITR